MKLDILLNTLQNFGVSQAIVKTISSLDLSFMDLIIDKKRENKLDKGYRKSAINKAVFAVKKMFDIININMLNDPMILISFNASKTAILKMNYMAEISSIDELEIFISDDIFF